MVLGTKTNPDLAVQVVELVARRVPGVDRAILYRGSNRYLKFYLKSRYCE